MVGGRVAGTFIVSHETWHHPEGVSNQTGHDRSQCPVIIKPDVLWPYYQTGCAGAA